VFLIWRYSGAKSLPLLGAILAAVPISAPDRVLSEVNCGCH
jgi:hypothetical protein